MPWKYNGTTLKVGRGFVGTDGTQYPQVWMRYSASEKATIGIAWEDPPASEEPFDSTFYSGRQSDGTLIPKDLAELKATWILKSKAICNQKLSTTDWYITRKAETDTAIPSSITTERNKFRTDCTNIETAITNASDLDGFIALFHMGKDGTEIAPIHNWHDREED